MNQTQKIYKYLEECGSITQAEALYLGCYRLASRISDLRKAGVPIVSSRVRVRKADGSFTTIARYALVKGGK